MWICECMSAKTGSIKISQESFSQRRNNLMSFEVWSNTSKWQYRTGFSTSWSLKTLEKERTEHMFSTAAPSTHEIKPSRFRPAMNWQSLSFFSPSANERNKFSFQLKGKDILVLYYHCLWPWYNINTKCLCWMLNAFFFNHVGKVIALSNK